MIKVYNKKTAKEGSTYLKLVQDSDGVVVEVVDFQGFTISGGNLLTITEEGVVRHEYFDDDAVSGIATKAGYVKSRKD